MRCPYCNEEMENGYIKSSHLMYWGKEKELGFILEDIKLVKNFWKGILKGNFVNASHCSRCNKIIISLDEPET